MTTIGFETLRLAWRVASQASVDASDCLEFQNSGSFEAVVFTLIDDQRCIPWNYYEELAEFSEKFADILL